MKTRVLAVLVCLFAAACGGSGGSPTAPAQQQPYTQSVSGTVSSFGTNQHSLTAVRGGVMTLSLSWPSSADLDLYLSATSCATLYPKSGCQILASSEKGGAVSESITRTVTSGETFKVWVDNLEFSSQTYTLAIKIE